MLSRLPHRIPFLAASAVRSADGRTVEGVFACTVNDSLPLEVMVVEAMAQFAGSLVLTGQGYLTGIDSCEITRPIVPGDLVTCRVSLEAEFGGTFRFGGTASVDGVEAARGRFYLASAAAHAPS